MMYTRTGRFTDVDCGMCKDQFNTHNIIVDIAQQLIKSKKTKVVTGADSADTLTILNGEFFYFFIGTKLPLEELDKLIATYKFDKFVGVRNFIRVKTQKFDEAVKIIPAINAVEEKLLKIEKMKDKLRGCVK